MEQKDTSELERKIDLLVYDLYGISEEERRIIDPSYGDWR
jgi:spore coat polysaccharide biosynthesis predicted glycosyltransferase SpsG